MTNLQLRQLLYDVRGYIQKQRIGADESALIDRINEAIHDTREKPLTEEQQAAEEGIESANKTFSKFLKNSN